MSNCKVSVIMAVYNSAEFLDEAILSVLNQSFTDFELIIVNDCSTDNSIEIIQKYLNVDNRIVLINNSENIGRGGARNSALKIARGKYIAILDSDDIALKERLQLQVDYLDNHLEIFLIGTGATKIDKSGMSIGSHNPITDYTKVKNLLIQKNCIYHSTVMFRNENFYYREKFLFSQDYDFYLQLLSANKNLSNIKNKLIKYRIYNDSASWKYASKQRLFANKALEFYYNRIDKIEEGYETFEPQSILNLDLTNSKDKIILETEIIAVFKLSNYKEMRFLCLRYFVNFGVLNKFFLMYILSFFGSKFMGLLKKL